MMKILYLIIIFLFCEHSIFAQDLNPTIISKEDNAAWITKFQSKDLENRLALIKDRLQDDLSVYFAIVNPHGKTKKKDGFDALTFVRPLYLFNINNGKPLSLPANMNKTMIAEVLNILNLEVIDSIELEDQKMASAIYGGRGSNGVIKISFKHEAQFQALKELIKNSA